MAVANYALACELLTAQDCLSSCESQHSPQNTGDECQRQKQSSNEQEGEHKGGGRAEEIVGWLDAITNKSDTW